MRNGLFTFGFFLLSLSACEKLTSSQFRTEDEPLVSYSTPPAKSSILSDFNVSPEEATFFVDMHFPHKSYSVSPIEEDGDILCYVFSFDKGWAIIAGDKRMNPILGQASFGTIKDANENVHCWLNDYKDEIRFFKKNSNITENTNTVLWGKIQSQKTQPRILTKVVDYKWGVFKTYRLDSITHQDIVPHLISTKWGQSKVYGGLRTWNYKCPYDNRSSMKKYCPTGCSAVAIAQMLYFTHYDIGKPNGLYHTISIAIDTISTKTSNIGFSRGDYHPLSERWDLMPKYYWQTHTDYVGDLMMDIGNRLTMKYAGNGSTSAISTYHFSYYSLSASTGDYNSTTVLNSIRSGKPVIVRGSSSNGGHAWIIDGLHVKTHHYTEICTFEYSENWMHADEYYDTFDELRTRYHINDPNEPHYFPYDVEFGYWLMNWGWNGNSDGGYYTLGDTGSWEGYDSNKKMFYAFH